MANGMELRVIESESGHFQNMYGDVIEATLQLQESTFGKDNRTWNQSFDIHAIGKYAANYEKFLPILAESAAQTPAASSISDVLRSGLDLVVASYGTLPIQYLGSVQPMTNEVDTVYYQKAVATTDRGTVKKGDILIDVLGRQNSGLDSFISEEQVNDSYKFKSGTDTYTLKLTGPIVKGTFKLSVASKVNAHDDGLGHVFGLQVNPDESTIDYATGTVVIKFSKTDGLENDDVFTVVYGQAIDSDDSVPSFQYDFDRGVIQARLYSIQATYSAITDLHVKQRFGKALSNELTRDVVSQINSGILFQSIRKLRASAITNEAMFGGAPITWGKTAAAGVSAADHRRTFTDTFQDAITRMQKLTGNGGVTTIILGSEARKVLAGIGFKSNVQGIAGPYLMGFFDGLAVFSAPSNLIPDDEAIILYRGANWFESPLVYAPYIPVTTRSVTGFGSSMLRDGATAFHSAGLEIVTKGYAQRVKLV